MVSLNPSVTDLQVYTAPVDDPAYYYDARVVEGPQVAILERFQLRSEYGGREWVRIYVQDHPQLPLYLPLTSIIVTDAIAYPLPEPEVPDPWGELPAQVGPMVETGEYAGEYALEAWVAFWDPENDQIVTGELPKILEPLAEEYGGEWQVLHEKINLAVEQQEAVEKALRSTNTTTSLQELGALTIELEVVGVAPVKKNSWGFAVDDGTHLVTLQAWTELHGGMYRVGDPMDTEIRNLRNLTGRTVFDVGEVLFTKEVEVE
jgi:hypothetical protein